MRLEVLERGHRLPARGFIRTAELLSRQRMDNVALTAMHRPQFWGKPFLALVHRVMRGPSYWTPVEREQLAVVVSRLNSCPYCARVHVEVARAASRDEVDVEDQALARREFTAVVALVEKLTTDPDSITPADVDAARSAGVPDGAIVDALHVCLIFNTVNRMANAFDWGWESDKHVRFGAAMLNRTGYHLPGFVLR